jgi:predicted transcriptional regulator
MGYTHAGCPILSRVLRKGGPTGTIPARLAAMEVHFTPEQEARLAEIATQVGTDAEHLVKNAALRLLERDAGFRAAVCKGTEQADRGEFIPDDEMEARIARMLQP